MRSCLQVLADHALTDSPGWKNTATKQGDQKRGISGLNKTVPSSGTTSSIQTDAKKPNSLWQAEHLLHRKSRDPGRGGVGSQTWRVACLVPLEGCSDDNSGRECRDYWDRAKSDGEREFSYYLYLNCISVIGHLQ
jgi:hypothetical protein